MTADDKNVVYLKEYMDDKFIAAEKELALFRETITAKFDHANQWREESIMRAQEFMTRSEFRQVFERIIDDIRSLRESRAEREGKASQLSVNITFLFALAGVLLGLAAFLVSLYREP